MQSCPLQSRFKVLVKPQEKSFDVKIINMGIRHDQQ